MKNDMKQAAWLSCVEFAGDHLDDAKSGNEWLRILRINCVIPAMSTYFWKNQGVVDCARPRPGAQYPKNVSEDEVSMNDLGSLIIYDEEQRMALERRVFGEYFLHDEVESALSDRESVVIRMRYFSKRPIKRKEIGREMQISAERARQLENQAIGRLRSRFLPDLDHLSTY